VGGLAPELSAGDVIAVMSQWGEIEDIRMPMDEVEKVRSKGFVFLKYEDWRSAILAVDNGNGVPLLGRSLRIDHKLHPPKQDDDTSPEG